MKSQEILPVAVSIVIIILIAVLQRHSRLVAAVVATMPLNVTFALWIVSSSSGGDRQVVSEFAQGLVLAILPSLGYLVAVWLGSRQGLKIAPLLALGYATWGVGLAVLFGLRRAIGL